MQKYKIVIDPGHGGSDRSNRGASGKYIEADGNLFFSLQLKSFLQDYFEVVLTREKDVTLTLTERGKLSKGAHLFLSVHSDAGPVSAGGVTIFGSVKQSNKDFGEKIGRAIATSMGINFRAFKQRESEKYPGQDYYTVIGTAQSVGCPIVLLLERGFHSNPAQEMLLLNDTIVRSSAMATAEEIKKYFSIKEAPLVGKTFKDVEATRWSAKDIEDASRFGILKGYPDGTFNPTGNVSREQLAVVAMRIIELMKGGK